MPDPSKLLIILQNLPPRYCGVGDGTILFAHELRRQKPDLKIAFLTNAIDPARLPYPADPAEAALLEGFEVLNAAPPYWTLASLPALWRAVRQSQASVVHLHYVPYMYYRRGVGFAVSLLMIWLRLRGLKVVVTLHECYNDLQLNPKRLAVALGQRLALVVLMAACHEIAITTRLQQRRLGRWLFWHPGKAARIKLCPIGSNFPDPPLTRPDPTLTRRKWGLPETGPILTCLGGLRFKEQLDWLLAALDAAKVNHPQAILLLIGSAGYAAHTGRSDIFRTGWVNRYEAGELLSASDLYLLPLEDGVTGRRSSLMPGLQYGLPVVSTFGYNSDADFVAELPARLVDATDRAAFALAVAELLIEPATARNLGDRAAAFYQTHFTWAEIVQIYLPLYAPLPSNTHPKNTNQFV